MINLTTKIHDKFTLEFKVGFNTEKAIKPMKYSDFVKNLPACPARWRRCVQRGPR